MSLFSELTKKLDKIIRCVENPDLWYLRQNDGIFDLYEKISQPWLKEMGIKTILDIGANIGQSTTTFARVFPDANIYAFEPIPDCYQKLEAKFANNKNVFTVNVAVGEYTGELELELSNYSPSSSFLKMHDRHIKAFPHTSGNEMIKLPVNKLDLITKSFILQEPILAKIDVQGFEDKVIAGGQETLKKCGLVILETSFDILYEGQPLFHDIYILMVDMGFQYAGSVGNLLDPKTKRCLQSDSLFVRNN
jgi:FkbM family methyltransferase